MRQLGLTFLQRCPLVLLQSLDGDGLQAHPGSRILLEHVPHVLLAEHEEVRVADRAYAGCSSVTCVDVAIYWLSGCIKLSYVTARDRFVSILRRVSTAYTRSLVRRSSIAMHFGGDRTHDTLIHTRARAREFFFRRSSSSTPA